MYVSDTKDMELQRYFLMNLILCSHNKIKNAKKVDKNITNKCGSSKSKELLKMILSTPYDIGSNTKLSYNDMITIGAWNYDKDKLDQITYSVAIQVSKSIKDTTFLNNIKDTNDQRRKNLSKLIRKQEIRAQKRSNCYKIIGKVAFAIILFILMLLVPNGIFNTVNESMHNGSVSFLTNTMRVLAKLSSKATIDRIVICAIIDGILFFPRKRSNK